MCWCVVKRDLPILADVFVFSVLNNVHVRRGKNVYLRELKASDVVEPATEGDKQNTCPQSMDSPNGLPKWITPKMDYF